MTKWRVKELCKEKGMTLAILAQKMGVKAPAVTQYLQSENMSSATLIKLADVLGVRIDDLIVREGCSISGYVEVNGHIRRISKKEDVIDLLTEIEQQETDTKAGALEQ